MALIHAGWPLRAEEPGREIAGHTPAQEKNVTVDPEQAISPPDWQVLLQQAREHNLELFQGGNMPELPGQGDWIPLRSCIGRDFVIRRVEFDASKFREDDEYARLAVIFKDDQGVERTVTAGGGYVLNQLRRLSDAELTAHVWTAWELLSLKGKRIEPFNGLYPIVLDYAGRPDAVVVEASK